ncbi:hypothetical protein KP509_30G037600 [Ceratopteris richardii]|uniref:Uncharacterized protein n=1 Tax=Ceratopteris richardii TaxID=49495 RepID=A0A8T2R2P3_CERRI|nr:hypothetical protein KP509_30G037600 [Ceratopteris richardii]
MELESYALVIAVQIEEVARAHNITVHVKAERIQSLRIIYVVHINVALHVLLMMHDAARVMCQRIVATPNKYLDGQGILVSRLSWMIPNVKGAASFRGASWRMRTL